MAYDRLKVSVLGGMGLFFNRKGNTRNTEDTEKARSCTEGFCIFSVVLWVCSAWLCVSIFCVGS